MTRALQFVGSGPRPMIETMAVSAAFFFSGVGARAVRVWTKKKPACRGGR